MFHKSAFSVAILGIAVAAGATATTTTSAHAYACKSSPHQAVGVRSGKFRAQMAARKGWTATAKSQYGLPWSVWQIAEAKTIDCSKLASGEWRCLSSAKPCKYVVQ